MNDFWLKKPFFKDKFDLVQINLGNLCNQSCTHCHIGASPQGTLNMDLLTANKIIDKLIDLPSIKTVEFTGGTPEMNENFTTFLSRLHDAGKKLVVRTSLTVLAQEEYAHFLDLYKLFEVKVIASLPSLFDDMTDEQRGKGVFNESIEVLKKLNALGYAKGNLGLDLVYNPVGTFLPKAQHELQKEYKSLLKQKFDVEFNALACIVNMPIKRFKKELRHNNALQSYENKLKNNYNENTLENVMCRRVLSVDYQGKVYDCDFNLALQLPLKGYEDIYFWDIDFDDFKPQIHFDSHCYGCTVNSGSSCHGEVVENFDAKNNAQEYYGEVLQSNKDLKTTACCTLDMIPTRIKEVLPYIAEEIQDKYYGCGSPIPLALKNQRILDLGSGSGRDVYILSKLVGEKGRVYGIDMTQNQIDVAKKYEYIQAKRFGYEQKNTEFIHDVIENIDQHFKPHSLDIITSNCVINLLEDKRDILKKVHLLLSNGGEFYFSDVYSSRRLSDTIKQDKVLHGECLGGALYVNDFLQFAKEAGFTEPRMISSKPIDITDEKVKSLVGNTQFYSITYRLWKLEDLDMVCEDYGQFATYKGGIEASVLEFELDDNHLFEVNRPERVCKNTAKMIQETRFSNYFEIQGDLSRHFGEFVGCATLASAQKKKDEPKSEVSSGCC
jgi:radical SAM/Cys-rich protein